MKVKQQQQQKTISQSLNIFSISFRLSRKLEALTHSSLRDRVSRIASRVSVDTIQTN